MKYIITLVLAMVFLTTNLYSEANAPKSLRQLVVESQYIVVGYVVKTQEIFDRKRVATIAIKENLQSRIDKDTIEIEFEPDMTCPMSDMYYDSTFVLAFVDKRKNGKFITHGLIYGSKTLTLDNIQVYKSRISEIQRIFTIKDKDIQFFETVEWLVQCAENMATRGEGTSELSPESRFIKTYVLDKKENYRSVLTEAQKRRLINSVLYTNKYPRSTFPDFGVVDMVYEGNEKELDDFMLRKLKALKVEELDPAEDFMKRLKHKNISAQMDHILKEYEKLTSDYYTLKQVKIIVDKFIKLVE